MKILKEGKLPEKETRKTCYNCKTKFTYLKSDCEIDRDGRYVRCPHCGSFIAAS